MSGLQRVRVVDSHTAGEPTRVVLEGGPDLGAGSAAERMRRLREDHDAFRSMVVLEPRGYDALVGAVLAEPADPECLAQVIFFNNAGYLGMCVHGTIGVAATLQHLGRMSPGEHRLETPVGPVGVSLAEDGSVTVENVVSYRTLASVEVSTRRMGTVRGDVAWGGNWFFLVGEHEERLEVDNVRALTDACEDIRAALTRSGIVGSDGGEVDHIELFGPPARPDCDSRNFVLCPGSAYDRSPCGTGTSAKMACLWADGKLKPGQEWRQESITGTRFVGSVREVEGGVLPRVTGRAWITGEADLIAAADDPLAAGIRG